MWFQSVIRTGCALFWIVTAATANADNNFYPVPNSQPLTIGGESFREGYLALRGLVGLHVDLTVVMSTGEDDGIVVPKSLEQQVRDKIESAGLFFLSKEEMLLTPGRPMMNLWPVYHNSKGTRINILELGQGRAAESTDNTVESPKVTLCRNTLWAGLRQSATLLQQPENQYHLSTWGDGEESEICEDRGKWMAEAVLRKLDLFIADYIRAQQDSTPVVVATTEDVPQHCSQSWVTHLNVFATNKSRINDDVKPIFDQLILVAKRCNTFNYIIETHADQRADSEYNKLLTEARARSIKDYLLSKGMSYSRIKMRPLGESAPIANGSTAADHEKNRRVIIKPVDPEEFENAELDY